MNYSDFSCEAYMWREGGLTQMKRKIEQGFLLFSVQVVYRLYLTGPAKIQVLYGAFSLH